MDDFHSLVDAFKDELTGAGTGINKALLEMIKKLKVWLSKTSRATHKLGYHWIPFFLNCLFIWKAFFSPSSTDKKVFWFCKLLCAFEHVSSLLQVAQYNPWVFKGNVQKVWLQWMSSSSRVALFLFPHQIEWEKLSTNCSSKLLWGLFSSEDLVMLRCVMNTYIKLYTSWNEHISCFIQTGCSCGENG